MFISSVLTDIPNSLLAVPFWIVRGCAKWPSEKAQSRYQQCARLERGEKNEKTLVGDPV